MQHLIYPKPAKNSDLSVVIDEASDSVTYFGFAPSGALTSDALWKIKKMTVTGAITKIEFANGAASYNNVFDDRASLNYI